MELRPDDCYAALQSRDSRFDGRFFTGVTSTGIYCRPVCPVHPPKRENCRFFPSAAAAERAGFRPCLRCRPETAPGTPAWLGTAASVSRALRLIDEGTLDTAGVDALATRLGIGARQLRRLFEAHLGAAPLAVAHTRRVQIAKRLIDETALPMIDVAHAAGFRSVRRFNAAVRQTYGRPPLALRRRVRATSGDGALVMRLAYRPPYDWAALAGFLALRAIPGVETADGAAYRRSVALGAARGVIEIVPDGAKPQLLLTVPAAVVRDVGSIVTRVRRLFDLDAEPRAIAARLEGDVLLAQLVRSHPGLRVPGAWDPFELAVRAILGQQVSVRGATTLAGRLAAAFGERLPEPAVPGISFLFPTPAALAGARLEEIGLTRARAETVRRLATAVCEGTLVLDAGADAEAVCRRLRQIPGVGEWTAQYVAMRALGDPDAFPATDLGLRRAAPAGIDLGARAEAWRPWRAYAALHLWTGGAHETEVENDRDVVSLARDADRPAVAGRRRRRAEGDRIRGRAAASGVGGSRRTVRRSRGTTERVLRG